MSRSRFILGPVMLALAALPSAAHGPTPQKIEETIEIAAPPAAVWAIVKEFAKVGDWHPLVAKSEGKGGNAQNGERTVTLKSGGDLRDSIDEFNEQGMSIAYRLAKENVEAFPVSFYSAEISVKPGANGGSTVDWIGRFYRADTGNEPAENRSDAAAIAAMKNYYEQGLKGLKAKAEAK